jgi:Leucine-rich repeat (LRR) protein
LAGLNSLQMIDFASNGIVIIKPLAELKHLEFLYLGFKQITDISLLAKQVRLLKILENGFLSCPADESAKSKKPKKPKAKPNSRSW